MTRAAFLGAFLIVAAGAASAAEPEPAGPRFQLIECPPGQDCRPRGKPLDTSTACALDMASLTLVVVKATRIKCERVKR